MRAIDRLYHAVYREHRARRNLVRGLQALSASEMLSSRIISIAKMETRFHLVLLGYEEYFPLPARCFCLPDGGANLVEGEWTRSRGHQNALAHKRGDFLDQLPLCCLVKSGKPVAQEDTPEPSAPVQAHHTERSESLSSSHR
jgi:hypothetical protein